MIHNARVRPPTTTTMRRSPFRKPLHGPRRVPNRVSESGIVIPPNAGQGGRRTPQSAPAGSSRREDNRETARSRRNGLPPRGRATAHPPCLRHPNTSTMDAQSRPDKHVVRMPAPHDLDQRLPAESVILCGTVRQRSRPGGLRGTQTAHAPSPSQGTASASVRLEILSSAPARSRPPVSLLRTVTELRRRQ